VNTCTLNVRGSIVTAGQMHPWGVLATVILAVHLTWIVWVIFGWLVARNRPVLRWLHFASLIYGIFIETAPWPCPLTLLEQWLESKGGAAVYREPFLIHYLEALVYPDVPERVLVSVAVAVCRLCAWSTCTFTQRGFYSGRTVPLAPREGRSGAIVVGERSGI